MNEACSLLVMERRTEAVTVLGIKVMACDPSDLEHSDTHPLLPVFGWHCSDGIVSLSTGDTVRHSLVVL